MIFDAFRRVGHLGMKLEAIDRQRPMFHRRERARGRGRQRHEIVGKLRDLIAVAHPNVDLLGHAGK